MNEILIKVGDHEMESNYTRKGIEQLDGLFLDETKPLLMDFFILFRPVTISSKSRKVRKTGEMKVLPPMSVLTFDRRRKLVRMIENFPQETKMRMWFREKYILEIPKTLGIPMEELRKITELDWRWL